MNQARTATGRRAISVADLASIGLEHIAYVRPVIVDGVEAVAIHSADGTPIGAAPTVDLAMAAIVQHDMLPVRLH